MQTLDRLRPSLEALFLRRTLGMLSWRHPGRAARVKDLHTGLTAHGGPGAPGEEVTATTAASRGPRCMLVPRVSSWQELGAGEHTHKGFEHRK